MSLWRRIATALGIRFPADASDAEPIMKLVVGLGNPGRQYTGTRHNVGFVTIDRLAKQFGVDDFRRQFSGRTATVRIGEVKTLLLKPETFMNRSGSSVQPALAFYGLTGDDLLVICDDLNLPVGKIRVRPRGSDGGQKGLRSIAEQLGTTDYPRLRIGIGAAPGGQDAADYVLSKFRRDEQEQIDEAIARAIDAIGVWCTLGIDSCMNRFN